ncbi:YeeE/YedE thiosulfate transporter family protein [Alienimonas sp. DA493]|uniref:YeeE/YedE thiosulfate transporter family protein n=1 Tax=Alienimonas sp. DA493 TaxID=3373605 RepID=UPI00375408C9
MFEEPTRLGLGLLTGILFGFLLQKGRVAKYHVILGQLLLKDWTVVKIMGSAVVVGSVGVFALVDGGQASLHLKPLLLGGVLVGAVLFGAGMAVLGYCPGTSVAACGEGRRDAMVGVLGMFAGAGLFVALYSPLQPLINLWGDYGKLTLPELFGVSPWLVVAGLVAASLLIVWLIESRPRRREPSEAPGAPGTHHAAG